MAAKKKVDPIKQREKRAKIAAIGGVVLLLLVAAWQVPKMMKLMSQKPATPPPASAAPVGTSGLPGVDGTASAGSTPGELADTDLPPAAQDDGQLVSFDVFETKDPFRPQVTNSDVAAAASSDAASTAAQAAPAAASGDRASAAASGEPAAATTAKPTLEVPTTTTPATAVPSTPSAPSTPQPTTTDKPVAQAVVISVNGAPSHVARGGVFPSGTPVFRVVSWAKGTARIGVVGGSYSTGDPTLELTLDKPVTLQNTSNGQRYKLVLVSTP